MASKTKPTIPLTGYQHRWVLDKSRFKIGVITRQGGKSFSTSLEAVDDVFEMVAQKKKTKWVLLSAGERQSKELMSKAAMHSRVYGLGIEELETDFWADSIEHGERIRYKQLEILYPYGSQIIGLPANPDTARGHSAHLLLDEFAFHRDGRGIWKALYPSITRGYKIRIISTFRGKANKFYELMYSAPTLQRFVGPDHEYVGQKGGWSKHLVNIYHAIAMGLELKDDEGNPCDPETLRLALNDEDAWLEEFECIPSDEASSFLGHDLISSVEDARLDCTPAWSARLVEAAYANYEAFRATKVVPALPLGIWEGVDVPGDLYLGFDVARHRDLSSIWVDADVAGTLTQQAVIDLKGCPFFVQRAVVHTIMSHPRFRRACIDKTGIGEEMAESCVDLFGEHRVEPIQFSQAAKEALAVGLKQNFEDRKSAIAPDSATRRSLHSVKRYATTTGHFRFDAERTETTGHADRFWAKGLAVQAANGMRIERFDAISKGSGLRFPAGAGHVRDFTGSAVPLLNIF